MKNPAITTRQPLLLTNPVFMISLVLLISNDFLFKNVYHNWMTGKLSDFAGLIVLALLLAYLFPKLGGKAVFFSGAIFVFWKSSFATPLIALLNIISGLPFHRIIDYTDLIALAVLPLIWAFIERLIAKPDQVKWPVWSRNLLILIGSFACTATAMSPKQRADYDGTIEVYKVYSLNVSKPEALIRLKTLGYTVQKDSTYGLADSNHYFIRQAILNQDDTLKSIRFKLGNEGAKSKLTVETFQTTHRVDMKTFRAVRTRYEELVKAGLISKMDN